MKFRVAAKSIFSLFLSFCLMFLMGCTGSPAQPEERVPPGQASGEEFPSADVTQDDPKEPTPAPPSVPGSRVIWSGSVADPEGIISQDISVPDSVLAAALDFVWDEYKYWITTPGDGISAKDDLYYLSDEPAEFDNWRIERLYPVVRYEDVEGMTLDVYRLNFQLHTTTQERARRFIIGGMWLEEDGWMRTGAPDAYYLIFSANGASEPVYLVPLYVNDRRPGMEDDLGEMFIRDVRYAMENRNKITNLRAAYEENSYRYTAEKSDLPMEEIIVQLTRALLEDFTQPDEGRTFYIADYRNLRVEDIVWNEAEGCWYAWPQAEIAFVGWHNNNYSDSAEYYYDYGRSDRCLSRVMVTEADGTYTMTYAGP